MKIQRIEIRNFRGFPGPQVYGFDLDGKNLLIYGENGSGKSSLFYAIQEFLDLNHRGRPFGENRNKFSSDQDGEISLHFDDGQPPAVWQSSGERPIRDARVSQTLLRTFCLDYRAILRTSFSHSGDEVNLSDLLVQTLLANFPVTVSGGISRPLRSVWEDLQAAIPKRNSKRRIKRVDALCDEFTAIMKLEMPRLEHEAESLLAFFPDCRVALHLKPEPLTYTPWKHRLEDPKILLDVDFNSVSIPSHQHFLNEARLSAIALALYLAGAKLSVPADLPGTPAPPRLLVFDDVLIGLDLSNRLPLLDILQQVFADWQIILMTYDKVWYDMVRMRNPDWVCQEIYATPSLIPVHKAHGDYLDKAREHLAHNDDHAAAVYARAEFERRLKKYCEDRSVLLPFKQRLEKLDTERMLKALEDHLKANPKWKTDPAWKAHYPPMFLNLRAARKVVLNPLSHSELVTIVRAEVQSAIDAVDAFRLV